MKRLSKRQYEIICIMWETNKPMLASEIVNAKDEQNINTVQSALKDLIEKVYI